MYGCNVQKPTNHWDVLCALFTSLSLPIFAFFDCHSMNPSKSADPTNQENQENAENEENTTKKEKEEHQAHNNEEYQLRVGIANRILSEHYSNAFWIPLNAKYAAQTLLRTPSSECTVRFVRSLRGYTVQNVVSSIQRSLLWNNCADHEHYRLSFYDKVLEVQYLMVLFLFIPLQTAFALYGMVYPYLVGYQIISDLHGHHSGDEYVAQNQVFPSLFESALASSPSVPASLYALASSDWYFAVFAMGLIGHFLSVCLIARKLWCLRRVFEMSLNVLIIADNSVLDQALILKMSELRRAMECAKVREQALKKLLGRYHLDQLVLEFVGQHTD